MGDNLLRYEWPLAGHSLPDTSLFCHEFHELTRRWR